MMKCDGTDLIAMSKKCLIGLPCKNEASYVNITQATGFCNDCYELLKKYHPEVIGKMKLVFIPYKIKLVSDDKI